MYIQKCGPHTYLFDNHKPAGGHPAGRRVRRARKGERPLCYGLRYRNLNGELVYHLAWPSKRRAEQGDPFELTSDEIIPLVPVTRRSR